MPPRPKTAKLSQNPLKFRNKGDRPLIFPVNADTARKTTRQRTPSNFKFNGKPINCNFSYLPFRFFCI